MRYSHCQPIRLCLVPPHPVKRAEPSFKHSTSKSAIAQQEHMQQPTASWSQLHVYFVCRKGPKIRFDGGVGGREVKAEPLFFSANSDLVLGTNQIIGIGYSKRSQAFEHQNVDLPRARVELRISDSKTDFVADALDARSELQCLDAAVLR